VIDKSDISSGQRPLTIDDNAVSVLRTQEGLCLDMPAPLTIFTDSLAGKAATEKQWASDRMRHIRHSLYFIKHYIASGDIKLAYMPGADLCADSRTFLRKLLALRQELKGSKWRVLSNIAVRSWVSFIIGLRSTMESSLN